MRLSNEDQGEVSGRPDHSPVRSDITTNNQNPGSASSDVAPLKDKSTTDPLESGALGSVEDDHQYWASYIVMGQAVLGIEAVLSMIYYLMTPKGSHRFAGIAIAALCVVVAIVTAAFAKKIAERSWRSKFVTVWMLVISGFLALSIGLDGWVDSPLRSLLVLPMIYVALSLPVRTVRLFVVVTFCELGLLVATDADWTRSVADVGLFASALWGVAILSVVWSAKRARLESSEILLRASVITLAQTDSLTGCLNHAAFYKRLEAEIDRSMRHDLPLALLMIDLDRFKLLNDTYGHVAGDEALALVGSVLRTRTRSFDIVGRIGGDEFAVVLPATGLSDGTEIADRLRKALDHPEGVQITASVGVAELCRTEPTTQRLARDADSGLYNAKAQGRDRTSSQIGDVAFTTTSMHQDQHRDTLIADLKNRDDYIRSANRTSIESLALLDAYQSSPAVGLGFADRDFRIIRTNDALAAINGSLAKDQVGKTIEEIAPEVWPKIRPALLQVLQTAEPVTNLEISGEPPSDLGNRHYWSVSYYPVVIEGTVIGIAIVVIDQSEQVRNVANKDSLIESIKTMLSDVVEIRDSYTAGHQSRVANICVALATDLGLGADEISAIGIAGGMHDLGKIIVPGEVLARPGHLRETEMALIREHSQVGADMLRKANFPEEICQMVLQHHERLDGSGYPQGLKAEQISTGARIIAVADTFDAMTADRPYRPALDLDLVVMELKVGSGIVFDADVVASCLRLIEDGQLASKKKVRVSP